MYCTKCGVELPENVRFCSSCGNRTAAGAHPEMPRALMLDKRKKKIAGVCAGVARYLDVDVVLVRVLWLGFALCTGVGFFVYVAALIIIPSDTCPEPRDLAARIPQAG
jgi:phage shock protein C